MKNSILFLFIFGGTIALSLVLPWWIAGPLTLALCYLARPTVGFAFLVSFGGAFLAWLLSIYFVDSGSIRELLARLLGISATMTPIVASLIGGILAGLFGMAGALLSPASVPSASTHTVSDTAEGTDVG